jgi:hypothetical protein
MKINNILKYILFLSVGVFGCLTSEDVVSNQYTTYEGKVYDIKSYTKHPDCQSCLEQVYGETLEQVFDKSKYDFHKTKSSVKRHLSEIYVGDLCPVPTISPPSDQPSTSTKKEATTNQQETTTTSFSTTKQQQEITTDATTSFSTFATLPTTSSDENFINYSNSLNIILISYVISFLLPILIVLDY